MLLYLTIFLIFLNLTLIYLLISRIKKERDIRKDAIEKSRKILEGKFREQLIPYFPEFRYNPTDARFIGTPIDFIIFDGAAENKLNKIIFLEIKCGSSKLTEKEKQIRDLIRRGKVEFEILNTKDFDQKTD